MSDEKDNPRPEGGGLLAALDELPLFPLPQAVLFPKALLPLHVFESRYRRMLKDCVETHGAMAVVLMKDPQVCDEHGQPVIAEIAGAGIVVEHQPLPDGRANILLHGTARVRLTELPFVPPYRRAKAVILEEDDTEPEPADRTALISAATTFATEVRKRDPLFVFRLPPQAKTSTITDLCAHDLVVDSSARQAILEELVVSARVQHVIRELAMQLRAIGGGETGGGSTLN